MTLTDQDIKQLKDRGITPSQILYQYQTLKAGIPFVDLRSAATAGKGLFIHTRKEQNAFVDVFEQKKEIIDLLKFTPASGAATRMFKFLFEFLENYKPNQESINAYINREGVPELRLFFVGIDSFPFYKKVRKRLRKKFKKKNSIDIDLNRYRFIEELLGKDGLSFGHKPKGLFPFHSYKGHIATAFEEHLFESALYANKKGIARLHFTISKEHQERFYEKFKKRKAYIELKTGVQFDISYSYQEPSTDTIAVTVANRVLRDQKDKLIFRPGGHGSLINNLNKQEADLIFIKNIDNVVVTTYREEVAFYKKMLAGKLLSLQATSFRYLKILNGEGTPSQKNIKEITDFLKEALSIKLVTGFSKYELHNQITYLKELLDRPIRVCGMVRNEGEPGGGPFWIRQKNGKQNLQIIESVQINPRDKRQQEIAKNATHFNPVDIVCGVKNYKGEKYDLLKFVDTKAGFIASKSYEGEPIKALEHPGLWNGAMAHWITIFVEVPLSTFDPVKTVNDLLKPAHQVR